MDACGAHARLRRWDRYIDLTFDGYDTKPGGPALDMPAFAQPSFGLNATVYGAAGESIPAVKVRYDNVVVDLK